MMPVPTSTRLSMVGGVPRGVPVSVPPVMTRCRTIGMTDAVRVAVCVTVCITLPVTVSIPVVFLRATTEQRHQHEQASRHCRKHIQIQHSRDCPPATDHLSTPPRFQYLTSAVRSVSCRT